MYMKRRDFLKFGSASFAGGMMLTSPVSFLSESKSKVGISESLLKNSGYDFKETSHLIKFERYDDAIKALQSKKIDALITSTQFLSKDFPELMLFGAFPSALSQQQKQEWINKEYSYVKSVYAKLGLNVSYVTMLSNLQIRFSKLSPSEIEAKLANSEKMVTVAQAARATWFKEMGFKVYQGKLFNLMFEQLLFMKRHDVQLTDAFPPGGMMQSLLLETQPSKPLNISDFKGIHIFKDFSTKDAQPIELVTRAGESYGDFNYVTGELVKLAKADEAFQEQVLTTLQESLNASVSEMPRVLSQKISMFRELHLNALSFSNQHISELVDRYKNFGVTHG